MKLVKKMLGLALMCGAFAVLGLTGCQNGLGENPVEYGTLEIVTAESSRAIDYGQLTTADVYVKGYGMTTVEKIGINLTNGKGTVDAVKVQAGTNRVVKVSSNLTGAVMYALVEKVEPGVTTEVVVNWDSTAKGHIFWSLLEKNENITKISASTFDNVIPAVHGGLVDVDNIVRDYRAGSLQDKSKYVLSTGDVSVTTSGLNGFTVRVTDIPSESFKVSGDSDSKKLKVYPGSWKVQVVDSNGAVVKDADINVASGYEVKVKATKSDGVSGAIVVHVPSSLNYKNVYYWDGDVTPGCAWPGVEMKNEGDYYTATLTGTKTKIIFNGNGQTTNLSVTEGEWEYIGGSSGTEDKNFGKISANFKALSGDGKVRIEVEEPVMPVMPAITISPAGGELFTTAKITVSLKDGNDTIKNASVTVKGAASKVYSYTDFTNDVLTIIPEDIGITEIGKTFTISGSVTNSVGTDNLREFAFTTKEKVQNSGEWNNLSIYQVMVSSFQDGDPSIGYSYAYGPSSTYDYKTNSSSRTITGGDLQGIINAADYIADLGVNAIWMTPIFDSSSGENNEYLNSTGYFCYDYFNVDPKFGTNEKFAELVEAYHSRGMYVILDGVFGHWNGKGVKDSPTGKKAVRENGQYKACAYPDSLEFFKEVAQYWIKEYKIDGWRFDQCYQVGNGDKAVGDNSYTGDHNYWYEIRTAIAEAAAENASAGSEWGTLGYTVGEHWNGDASKIQRGSVAPGENGAGYGLQSCFDFPSRYRLVQTMAREEGTNTATDFGASMAYTYGTFTEKGYEHPEGYYPNLFFTNHDLVRYGNLLNWKFKIDPTSDEYFARHKLMLSVLAGYTGPITTYYGDEWGAIVKGYDGPGSLGAYNDNMARSTGKISGFTEKEEDLISYYKKLMNARNSHPAMWNGDAVTIDSTATSYVVRKTCDSETITICFNNGTSATSFKATGTDLITGQSYSGTVSVPALSAVFVLE